MTLILRRVVLVRHGQYDEHDTGKLTTFGRKQAAVTAHAFKGMRIDAMVSSTLIRAKETAEIIADGIGHAKVVHSSLLCECVPTPLPASLRVGVDPAHVRADRKRADGLRNPPGAADRRAFPDSLRLLPRVCNPQERDEIMSSNESHRASAAGRLLSCRIMPRSNYPRRPSCTPDPLSCWRCCP